METKIQTIEILKDYHKITGARVSLHDLDFNEIAGYPESPSYFCGKIQQNKTAKQLGIPIITEQQLMEMIN